MTIPTYSSPSTMKQPQTPPFFRRRSRLSCRHCHWRRLEGRGWGYLFQLENGEEEFEEEEDSNRERDNGFRERKRTMGTLPIVTKSHFLACPSQLGTRGRIRTIKDRWMSKISRRGWKILVYTLPPWSIGDVYWGRARGEGRRIGPGLAGGICWVNPIRSLAVVGTWRHDCKARQLIWYWQFIFSSLS